MQALGELAVSHDVAVSVQALVTVAVRADQRLAGRLLLSLELVRPLAGSSLVGQREWRAHRGLQLGLIRLER